MSLSIDQQITFLYTTDIQKSAPFYEVVLGLQLVLDQGSCRIYRMVDRTAYVGICEREVPREPNGVIFTFVTADVDGWYERVRSHGIEPEHAPQINEHYRIYHFFVKDPSGYLIEFQRFLDDPWEQT